MVRQPRLATRVDFPCPDEALQLAPGLRLATIMLGRRLDPVELDRVVGGAPAACRPGDTKCYQERAAEYFKKRNAPPATVVDSPARVDPLPGVPVIPVERRPLADIARPAAAPKSACEGWDHFFSLCD